MKTVGASSTPSVATPRAVLIGLALAVVVNLFSLWSNYLLGYVHITFAHIDLGLLIPFFLGVLGPNILIKAVRPSWGLQNKELLFVFVLGWVGFMVPAWGMSNYVVNVMATAEYYASPENQWRELVFPFLPDWVIVTNEQNANRDYYWGLPASAPIPWSAWIIPSFWWMSFFAGLLAVGICFVILMRRQWAEHERLSYPLAQTPVVMTETTGETDEVLPSIMRNRMFIAGRGGHLLHHALEHRVLLDAMDLVSRRCEHRDQSRVGTFLPRAPHPYECPHLRLLLLHQRGHSIQRLGLPDHQHAGTGCPGPYRHRRRLGNRRSGWTGRSSVHRRDDRLRAVGFLDRPASPENGVAPRPGS